MIKNIIFIAVTLLLIILLVNRVETNSSVDQNLESIIGCKDYDYTYQLNIPATLSFYVIKNNGEDPDGPFKVINAEELSGSTILHCGNSYFLIVSAYGYEDYTEKIENKGFRPITSEVHKINLEKK